MIRLATLEDVPVIVAMGTRFAASSAYAGRLPVTAGHLRALAAHLIDGEAGVIFLAEIGGAVVGMLALTTYPHPMTGELVASELAWWMDPEARGGTAGVRLLRAAQRWASGRQAVHFVMIAPDDRVGAFYEAMGFSKAETIYERRV